MTQVASQFMENFCSEPEWLARLSGHYKSGEAMPADMVDALVKGREFLSGMAMLRQVNYHAALLSRNPDCCFSEAPFCQG